MENSFDPDLIHAIFKLVWRKKALEREKNEGAETMEGEVGAGSSKRNRPTSANSNAVKLSCELLRVFVTGLHKVEGPLPRAQMFITVLPSDFSNSDDAHSVDAEAIQRAATIAEAEGVDKIEATHLERILPQLLLDF